MPLLTKIDIAAFISEVGLLEDLKVRGRDEIKRAITLYDDTDSKINLVKIFSLFLLICRFYGES